MTCTANSTSKGKGCQAKFKDSSKKDLKEASKEAEKKTATKADDGLGKLSGKTLAVIALLVSLLLRPVAVC